MKTASRRNRHDFRPNLGVSLLEERVVLNAAPAAQVAAAADTGNQAGIGDVTSRELYTAYRQQFRAAQQSLRLYVLDQVSTLYSSSNLGANGQPTAQAFSDFNSNLSGAVNATAYRLSSQASLLPGSARRLVPSIQESLLGQNSQSLASRIGRSLQSSNVVQSRQALESTLGRQINAAFAPNTSNVTTFIRSAPLDRLAVDSATGNRVALSQYLGNQASRQINNSFGSLANSVGTNARSALFDSTGVFNPQATAAFQQQYANALGTAAFQANNVLSVLPNSSTVSAGLQPSLFGTGTSGGVTNTNLFNALTGAFPAGTNIGTPFTPDLFNTAFQNGFTGAFQNFASPINNFLGSQLNTGTQLPNGFFQTDATFPGVFGNSFTGTSFNSGFNNGFSTTGTGFPGFGTAPTDFNTSFGTGFNGLIGSVNQQTGITLPSFSTGIGTIDPGLGAGTINAGLGGTGTIGTIDTGLGGVGVI